TPRYAQLLGLLVAAYAFSPIDLIPDFIPGLGLLDDLVIIPLGLKLVSGMIPADVRAETRARAAVSTIARPRFWRWVAIITIIVVLFWLLALGVMLWLVLRWLW